MDKEVTYALISEYKKYRNEFKNPTKKEKKILWRQIAQNLIKQGFTMVRTDICEKKWRSLKRTFKAIYLGERSSDAATMWFLYDALGDIFGNDPDIIERANLLKRKNTMRIDSQNKFIAPEEHVVVSMDTVENSYEELGNTNNFNTIATVYTKEQPQPKCFLDLYQQDKERKIKMLQNVLLEIEALEEKLEKLIKTDDSSDDNIHIKTC